MSFLVDQVSNPPRFSGPSGKVLLGMIGGLPEELYSDQHSILSSMNVKT